MKKIVFEDAHRKKHFELFNNINHPHFNLTAKVDIAAFLEKLKKVDLPFTSSVVYLICKTINDIPAFRWRIRGNDVVEHDIVHPSFTVNTDVTDVFSFCHVSFDYDARKFIARATAEIERMKTSPSMEDEPGRDDYLFLSSIPWVHFTGLEHAMPYHPTDSVPRITWGKYRREGNSVWLPICIQAHHAVVDGRHIGLFFENIQRSIDSGDWI